MFLIKHRRWAAVLAGAGLFLAVCLPAQAEKRVALVVGNSNYQSVAQLPNPSSDANAVAELLRSVGFDYVDLENDEGYLAFKRAIRKFEDAAVGADIALVFFAGHGIEVGGINYMIPIDAKLADERDAEDEAVDLRRIVDAAAGAKKLALVIVDACRNNPFIKTRRIGSARRAVERGLARIDPQEGTDTLVAYAAKAGSTAEDGHGGHSPLTTALLHHIAEPGLDVRLAFGRIRDEVLKITDNRQEPFVYGSLGGSLISLVPAPAQSQASAPAATDDINVKHDYDLVEKVGTKRAWEIFLLQHPTGFYADLARAQLEKLGAETKLAKLEPPPSQPASVQPVLDDEREWAKLKESSDQQAIRDFIKRYPNSPRALDAKNRLDKLQEIASEQEQKAASAEWDKIKGSDDPQALQAFAKRYANSPLAQDARMRLDALRQEEKARAEWAKLKDSADQNALKSFIARHPNSPLASNAQSRLAALQQAAEELDEKARTEWEKLKESSDQSALKSFIARYPSSPLVPNAQSRVNALLQFGKEQEEKARAEWEKLKASSDQAALQSFIGRYPNSPLMPKAQKRLDALAQIAKEQEDRARGEWAKIKGSNDPTPLKSFIARYPNSPLVAEAQSRLDALEYAAKEQEQKAQTEREAAEQRAAEEWEKIKDTVDQPTLQVFIKNYRDSPLVQAATKRLEALAEEQEAKAGVEWGNIKDTTDQAALQSFIATYPSSPLKPRAQSRLDYLQQFSKEQENKAQAEWAKIKSSSDLASLRSFIAHYPNSPLTSQVQSRLDSMENAAKEQAAQIQAEWDQIKDSDDLAAVKSFVEHHPKSSLTSDAQSRLQTLLVVAAKRELSRLGCFSGEADGTLNLAMQESIGRYLSRRGRRNSKATISESFLSELRGQQSRICPLECAAGEKPEGDTCVVDTQPSEPVKASKEEEEAPTKRKAATARSERRPLQPRPQVRQEVSAHHSGSAGGATIGVGF
jgi:outer membrane protein assembly factor BamD (BamD/ComL family)